MMLCDSETVLLDHQLQRLLFKAVMDLGARQQCCFLCGMSIGYCTCFCYDDGEHGILRDRRVHD